MTNQRQSEHEHVWEMSDWVIDTAPPTYTWHCDCGAATHDPETDELCSIKHPDPDL